MAASGADERVALLRQQLSEKKLDAYIVPTADAHMVGGPLVAFVTVQLAESEWDYIATARALRHLLSCLSNPQVYVVLAIPESALELDSLEASACRFQPQCRHGPCHLPSKYMIPSCNCGCRVNIQPTVMQDVLGSPTSQDQQGRLSSPRSMLLYGLMAATFCR